MSLNLTFTDLTLGDITMTMKRSLLIAAAAILIPMGSALALTETQFNSPEIVAQRSSQRGNNRSEGPRDGRWMEELDLSPEQSESIEAIREDSKQAMEPLREELQQAREEMQSLMASDTATTDQLRQQHQQVQDLIQQLGDERFETMLSIREELTPEQRAQMAALMEQRREQRGRGYGQGGRFGEGRE